MLSNFHILTVSHKEIALDLLPGYTVPHADEDELKLQLQKLKRDLELDELLYLSTCNRIVYFFVTEKTVDKSLIRSFFSEGVDISPVKYMQSEACLSYFFQVASSLHSLVVGEREILKQIKVAYDVQSRWRLTGDNLRLAIQHTIRTAKKVYQSTLISERPVSIVSLAVRKLLEKKQINKSSQFLLVGAGATIQLVIKHLSKKGFKNFSIYNRTGQKAVDLAASFEGLSGDLQDLENHALPFDCLIACTGATSPVVTEAIARKLSDSNVGKKIWMDLGMPGDIDPAIMEESGSNAIGIESLRSLAEHNMAYRKKEVKKAEAIIHESLESFESLMYQRRIEKAFQLIPREIKSVKEKALSEVFGKELSSVDEDAQALISRMMDYMEKKCIGIPMKAAKDAVL